MAEDGDEARTVWLALAPLVPPGRLTPSAAQLFAQLCIHIATYREAHELVIEAGILVAAGNSADLLPNPAMLIRDRLDPAIVRGMDLFGLLPNPHASAPDQPRHRPHLVE